MKIKLLFFLIVLARYGVAQETTESVISKETSVLNSIVKTAIGIAINPNGDILKGKLPSLIVTVKNTSQEKEAIFGQGDHTVILYSIDESGRKTQIYPKEQFYDGSGGAIILAPDEYSRFHVPIPANIFSDKNKTFVVSVRMADVLSDSSKFHEVLSKPFSFPMVK